MTQRTPGNSNPPLLKLLFVLLCLPGLSALAQAPQADAANIEPVTVMVTGRRPGPPLWKVSKDNHVLYIFGYLSPLPKGLRWDPDRVEEVLGSAQEFIGRPNFGWNTSLPRDVLRLSDGRSLEDALPPNYWERYLEFTQSNFRRNRSIEKLRPVFAVSALTNALYGRHDLVSGDKVLKAIGRMASHNRALKHSDPNLAPPEGLMAALGAASAASVLQMPLDQELACFQAGLERIMPNINLIKRAANAWAEADVVELDHLHHLRREEADRPTADDGQQRACSVSVSYDPELQARADAYVQDQAANWIAVVETALANNSTTFAILDMNMLLDDAAVLGALRSRGYDVQVPGWQPPNENP